MNQETWRNASPSKKVELIKGVWQPGMNSTVIAAAFGVSRSAILSTYRRNSEELAQFGLCLPIGNIKLRPTHAVTPAVRPAVTVEPPARKKLPDDFVCVGMALVDLEHDNCRWPITDGKPWLFCGNETEPKDVYCKSHRWLSKGFGTHGEQSALRGIKA